MIEICFWALLWIKLSNVVMIRISDVYVRLDVLSWHVSVHLVNILIVLMHILMVLIIIIKFITWMIIIVIMIILLNMLITHYLPHSSLFQIIMLYQQIFNRKMLFNIRILPLIYFRNMYRTFLWWIFW